LFFLLCVPPLPLLGFDGAYAIAIWNPPLFAVFVFYLLLVLMFAEGHSFCVFRRKNLNLSAASTISRSPDLSRELALFFYYYFQG